MQHFCAYDIPCVMVGTTGIERTHAIDEYVELDELTTVAHMIVRVLRHFVRRNEVPPDGWSARTHL